MTSETAVATASPTTAVDTVPVSEAIPSEFGGYRVVRVLSRSEWSTTAVVHGLGETRVARIYSAACPTALIDRELAVHDVIARAELALREHSVALHDLVTLVDRRLALIVELVAGPTLSDVLLTRHGQLAIGEAVTILAPLADALESAHDAGLTGLSLTPAAVRFSASRAPVVTRLTDALPGPVLPERFRALEPAYADDVASFQLLGAAVTAAVIDADRPGLVATLAAPRTARPLSAALFDLAAPVPVVLDAPTAPDSELDPTAPPAPTAPTRPTVPTAVPPVTSSASSVSNTSGPRPASSVTRATPRWIVSALDTLSVLGLPVSVLERVRAVAQGVGERATGIGERAAPMVERVRGVRRGYLVAGAGGVVALVIAVALVALGAGSVGPVADEGGVVGSRGEASAPVASEAAVDDSASTVREEPETSTRAIDGRAPESLVDPSAEEWPSIIRELVDRWRECHAALASAEPGVGLGCASEVVHAGSAAAHLIGVNDARHEVLERWRDQGGESVVTERMGGAALIDLLVSTVTETTGSAASSTTTAASLLVVRSEAGWRVRDVLSDNPVD